MKPHFRGPVMVVTFSHIGYPMFLLVPFALCLCEQPSYSKHMEAQDDNRWMSNLPDHLIGIFQLNTSICTNMVVSTLVGTGDQVNSEPYVLTGNVEFSARLLVWNAIKSTAGYIWHFRQTFFISAWCNLWNHSIQNILPISKQSCPPQQRHSFCPLQSTWISEQREIGRDRPLDLIEDLRHDTYNTAFEPTT